MQSRIAADEQVWKIVSLQANEVPGITIQLWYISSIITHNGEVNYNEAEKVRMIKAERER